MDEAQIRPTLLGVATGNPDGGVAILRLSGPRAFAIAKDFVGKLPEPRMLMRRRFGLEGGEWEDALVVVMQGPRSFTGEDVVEFHIHGGQANVSQLLEALLAAGAHAAGPGDFSRRAFEHDRLTLDQAEGIAALVGAQTKAALSQARRLVAGELGDQVRALAARAMRLRVEVEANLDFPDDVDDASGDRWRAEIGELRASLGEWLARFEAGRRAREVPRVVLAGRPNAGKSSLFNALLKRSRALVSEAPGTTRDYVEARLELGSHALMLVDTAGIRSEGAESVEAAGIGLSREQLSGADLVLWLRDPLDTGEAVAAVAETESEIWELWTKADLAGSVVSGRERLSQGDPATLRRLMERLSAWVGGDRVQPWIGLARHRDCVRGAEAAFGEADQLVAEGGALELVAFSLALALTRLREIDGRAQMGPVGDELLAEIFSTFCIGK